MAQRRMFSLKIIDTDAFLEMPLSTQALYFHLGMRADDDGFISNAKKIQRSIGAAEDDLKLLLAKRFLLALDNGVVVVKHWRINNYIQKDRYVPSLCHEGTDSLYMKKNGIYTDHPNEVIQLPNGECIQDVYIPYTQYRLGKVSIGNNILYNSPEPKNDSGQIQVLIPLNSGEEYPIYESDVSEWTKLYPAVDVKQELNNMRGWCLANPSKRKTKSGVKRFINSWLSKTQNKGGTNGYTPIASGKNEESRGQKKYKEVIDENGFVAYKEIKDGTD